MGIFNEIVKKRKKIIDITFIPYIIAVLSMILLSILKSNSFSNLDRNIKCLVYGITFSVSLILYLIYFFQYRKINNEILVLISQTNFAEFKKYMKSLKYSKELLNQNLQLLSILRNGNKFLKEEFWTRSMLTIVLPCILYSFLFIIQFVILEMWLDLVYRIILLIVGIISGLYGLIVIIKFILSHKRINRFNNQNLKDIEIIAEEMVHEYKEESSDELNEEDARKEKEKLE